MERILLNLNDLLQGFKIVLTHPIFWICLASWLIASVVKIIIFYFQARRIDFRLLVDTGRMPSSHSAFVSCLATVLGLEAGFSNPVFLLALGFAILTMNDAQGVRRAAGQQAAILNRIADDMYLKKPFRPERVKEFLGHTRLEVLTGSVIGIACGVLLYR